MCVYYPSYMYTHTQEDGVTVPSVWECSDTLCFFLLGIILLAREK